MKNWLKNNAYFGIIMWAILVGVDIFVGIPRYIYIPLTVVVLIIFLVQISASKNSNDKKKEK